MIDIKAIRKLCDMATPGPWGTSRDGTVQGEYAVCHAWKTIDAEFIAKSREIIPALLDELEAAQNAQRWIPVKERLPEFDESEITKLESDRGKPVLVVEDGHVVTATWWIREKVFRVDGFKVEPTYWMQLPEPPKGETHEKH